MKDFRFFNFRPMKDNPEKGSLTSGALTIFGVISAFIIIFFLLSPSDDDSTAGIWTNEPSVSASAAGEASTPASTTPDKSVIDSPETLETKKAMVIRKAQNKYLNTHMMDKYRDDDWVNKVHYGGGLMDIKGDASIGYSVVGFGTPVIGDDDEVSQTILNTKGEAWIGYWGTGGNSHYVAIFTTKARKTYYISNSHETPVLYEPKSLNKSLEFAVAKKLSESLLL